MNLPLQAILLLLLSACSLICQVQQWDIDILREVNGERNRALDAPLVLITDLAAPIAYSIPLFLLVFAIRRKNALLKSKAIFVIRTALLALIVCTAIKHTVNRQRPFHKYAFIEKASSGSSPSFPSGHTSDAFALAASLTIAFPRRYLGIILFVWAAMVGYSRMHLGVHFPSDVIASILIAYASAFFTLKVFRYRDRWIGGVESAVDPA